MEDDSFLILAAKIILFIILFTVPYFSVSPTESGEIPNILFQGFLLIPLGFLFAPYAGVMYVWFGRDQQMIYVFLLSLLGVYWLIHLVKKLKKTNKNTGSLANTLINHLIYLETAWITYLAVIGEFW